MGEFASLEKDMIPVFEDIQMIKERYGITSMVLESYKFTEQFHGSHGGKNNFAGQREHRYARDPARHFVEVK